MFVFQYFGYYLKEKQRHCQKCLH